MTEPIHAKKPLTGAQLTARGVIDMELRIFAQETEDFQFADQDEENAALADRLARVLFPEQGKFVGNPFDELGPLDSDESRV